MPHVIGSCRGSEPVPARSSCDDCQHTTVALLSVPTQWAQAKCCPVSLTPTVLFTVGFRFTPERYILCLLPDPTNSPRLIDVI